MANFVGIFFASTHRASHGVVQSGNIGNSWEALLSGDMIEVLHNTAFSSHGLV